MRERSETIESYCAFIPFNFDHSLHIFHTNRVLRKLLSSSYRSHESAVAVRKRETERKTQASYIRNFKHSFAQSEESDVDRNRALGLHLTTTRSGKASRSHREMIVNERLRPSSVPNVSGSFEADEGRRGRKGPHETLFEAALHIQSDVHREIAKERERERRRCVRFLAANL